MGLILLVGLIVKNGIILVDYADILSKGQPDRVEALVQAGAMRLRPILMTTLCTLFGLLPLALGLGSGAEMQKPLAIAVIGGLSVSTVVTLVFVPALLALVDRRAGQSSLAQADAQRAGGLRHAAFERNGLELRHRVREATAPTWVPGRRPSCRTPRRN